MADTEDNDDQDILSRRESHFNQQRSSLRSDRSSFPSTQSRSRTQSHQRLNNHAPRAESETCPSDYSHSSPAPNVPFTRSRASSHVQGKSRARAYSSRSRNLSRGGPDDAHRLEELLAPASWADPYQLLMHGQTSTTLPLQHVDITALPSIASTTSRMNPHVVSKPTPSAQRMSSYLTELYTISYLIFFAIWGTLARLGLQALTFYPGAPVVFSELWANVAGTIIIGFLAEDQLLFAAEWGHHGDKVPEPDELPVPDKKRHGKVKKTIPLYIGLATGFCGCFTSFSSFIRDVFLALSNDLKAPHYHPGVTSIATVPRNNGYSVLAVLATIITTISLCYCALRTGAHFALLVQPIMPTLPFRFTRRIIDPMFVPLAWGCWLGAIILSIFPPHNAWRSQAIFACVFAPLGCLLRYYVSLALNPILSSFPLGTFTVNIFGTAVLGMAYDLQRVPLHYTGIVGGSLVGCQVLQGIQDGFCGALTTVSSWIAELEALKTRAAYVYGAASIGLGLCLAVAIMGSVRWTVGWDHGACGML